MEVNNRRCQKSSYNSGCPQFKARSLWTVITLAALLLIFFQQSLFFGKGLVPSEGIFQHLPWRHATNPAPANYLLSDQYRVFIPQHQFVQHRIVHGDFPLWNPYLNCGLPNVASMQGALLFPIQLLLSPIDPFYASGIAAFLKLFFAGLFTILYVRRLSASYGAALLSGIIFSLSGFMIVWLGHPQVNCAMWLPLLLYLIEGQFSNVPQRSRSSVTAVSVRRWTGFAAAYGCMLLGGHPPTAIHITIVIAGYGLFRLITDGSRKRLPQVALLICALLAGTLLAAPQLLPYLEYYRESSSSLSSATLGRWATHLSPNAFIHFLLPHAFGSPAVGYQDLPGLLGLESIDNFNERTGYVGIVTILLALCAIFLRRCTFSFFYLAAALIATAIVFGLPPVPAILQHLPIINDINHTRLLMLIGFSLAILAGLGLDTLSRIKSRRGILCIVIVFWAVIGVSLFWLGSFCWPKLSALDQPRRDFLFWQLLILAGGIVPSVIITLQLKGRWQWVSGFVCLAWTTFDLFWFAYGYNPSISRDRYYPKTGVIEFLQKDPSLFRIIGFENILAPNTAATYGLYDVRGCDFMAVKRYEELVTGKAGDFSFYTTVRSLPPVFPLLNVKYVLAPKQAPVNATQFELVYSNEVAVYRFKSCLERALVVFEYKVYRNPEDMLSLVRSGAFNPRQVLLLEEEPKMAGTEQLAASPATTVHIISYQPDDAAIEVSVPRPAFLLLLDTYFPGWVATVNGQSAHIYRVDYNFRAVSLPAGKSLVRFTYKPMSMRLGFILSFVSMVLLIIAWFWCGIRKESIEKQ